MKLASTEKRTFGSEKMRTQIIVSMKYLTLFLIGSTWIAKFIYGFHGLELDLVLES